jgi:hypothetical protein
VGINRLHRKIMWSGDRYPMKSCNSAIKYRECRTSAPLTCPRRRPCHSERSPANSVLRSLFVPIASRVGYGRGLRSRGLVICSAEFPSSRDVEETDSMENPLPLNSILPRLNTLMNDTPNQNSLSKDVQVKGKFGKELQKIGAPR